MAIYKNGKQPNTLYMGGGKVNKAYLGGNIVYEKNSLPPEYGYIEFVIDSTSGSFTIPFSGYSANGNNYSVNIYVNGNLLTDYTFTSSYENGTGYEVTELTGNETTIKIKPTGNAVVGWGRFFGFYNNTIGCNSHINRAKLLRIVNDPDFAYLENDIYTGDHFRYYQYSYCIKLIQPAEETLPDQVTTIGDFFRNNQYTNCSALTQTAVEVLPDSVITIGNDFRSYQYINCRSLVQAVEVLPNSVETIGRDFRSYQYYNCSLLSQPAVEVLPDSVKTIGHSFRSHQYALCYSLTQPAIEILPDSVTTIGSYFRSYQYHNCISLTQPAEEVLPNSLIYIGSDFRRGQYGFCSSLTGPAVEVLPDSVTTIGDYFRSNQYDRCSSLSESAAEILPPGVTSINSYFRSNQYKDCSSLLVGNHIHHHLFQSIINGYWNYLGMFNISSTKTDSDTVPQYYTDSSHTSTAPITDLNPTSEKFYLTNRTGIEGYDEIDSNWK